MKERAYDLVDEAVKFRTSGALVDAGDAYTAAAHEFAGSVLGHSFPEPDDTVSAVSRFCHAATCYRVVGDQSRTRNRCELGTLLAEDYMVYIDELEIEQGSFGDLRQGAWPEFIGDLRLIAGKDDADEAYDHARSVYESAGDYELVIAEQEHTSLASFFRSIRRGLGHDIPDDAPEMLGPGTTFSEWIAYKRERLPRLLDELESQGSWPIEPSE